MNSPFSDVAAWDPALIDPSWVIDGAPVTRVQPIVSGDLSSGFWDCTAGNFDWHYGAAESIYIIKGSAMVRDRADGVWQHLSAGESITFPPGSIYEWVVPDYVCKFWVIGPRPSLLRRLIRRVRGAK